MRTYSAVGYASQFELGKNPTENAVAMRSLCSNTQNPHHDGQNTSKCLTNRPRQAQNHLPTGIKIPNSLGYAGTEDHGDLAIAVALAWRAGRQRREALVEGQKQSSNTKVNEITERATKDRKKLYSDQFSIDDKRKSYQS